RAIGDVDTRLRRQIGNVGLQRQCIDVDVDRGFVALGERRRGSAEREMRSVERPLEMRRHANLGLIFEGRKERNAERELLDTVLAGGRSVVEGNRSVVDLDVIERESRRWPFGRRQRLVDQVLYAVTPVAIACERNGRTHELERIEYRRPMHERRR